MRVRIEFRKQGKRTQMVSTTELGSREDLEKLVDMGAVEGFNETWDRLVEHLANIQS